MPYTRFVKSDGKVKVYKKEGNKEVLAFTSNSSSLHVAHRTAGIREAASEGRLRKKIRKNNSSKA